MPTQQEIAEEIARLEELLNSGAKRVSSDNESVDIDTDGIRKRLAELRGQVTGSHHTARRVRSFDLGSAW